MFVAAFGIIQFLVSGYAFWKGGAPERCVATLLLIAAITSWSVPAGAETFHHVFWPVFWIDTSLLLGLTLVAIFADRFWPLWVTACQILAVACHGVRGYDPGLWALTYWLIVGSIAYPMLALLVAGTWRHQCRQHSGVEFGWTAHRLRRERAVAFSGRRD